MNIERLWHNLASFKGRYEVVEKAVGVEAGQFEFDTDETNRYGGIGRGEELQALGWQVTTSRSSVSRRTPSLQP